jgi:hypothetical protein
MLIIRRCRPWTDLTERCVVLGSNGTSTSDNVCEQCAQYWNGAQCQLAEVKMTVRCVCAAQTCGGVGFHGQGRREMSMCFVPSTNVGRLS